MPEKILRRWDGSVEERKEEIRNETNHCNMDCIMWTFLESRDFDIFQWNFLLDKSKEIRSLFSGLNSQPFCHWISKLYEASEARDI